MAGGTRVYKDTDRRRGELRVGGEREMGGLSRRVYRSGRKKEVKNEGRRRKKRYVRTRRGGEKG